MYPIPSRSTRSPESTMPSRPSASPTHRSSSRTGLQSHVLQTALSTCSLPMPRAQLCLHCPRHLQHTTSSQLPRMTSTVSLTSTSTSKPVHHGMAYSAKSRHSQCWKVQWPRALSGFVGTTIRHPSGTPGSDVPPGAPSPSRTSTSHPRIGERNGVLAGPPTCGWKEEVNLNVDDRARATVRLYKRAGFLLPNYTGDVPTGGTDPVTGGKGWSISATLKAI